MKKFLRMIFMPLAAAALAVGLTACHDSDNGHPRPGLPQIEGVTVEAFQNRYPDAAKVQWSVRGDYAVALFYDAGYQTQPAGQANVAAWFLNDEGMWMMTETRMPYSQIPPAVSSAYAAGGYASWVVTSAARLERLNRATLYVLEAESAPNEIYLVYTAGGLLVETETEIDESFAEWLPELLPAAVLSYIATTWPDAQILTVDDPGDETVVTLIGAENNRFRVWFNDRNEWSATTMPVAADALPADVTAAWEASEFAESAGYRLAEATFVQTAAEGSYYLLELTTLTGGATIRIAADGSSVAPVGEA